MNEVATYNLLVTVVTVVSILSFLLSTKVKLWGKNPMVYLYITGIATITGSSIIKNETPGNIEWATYHLWLILVIQVVFMGILTKHILEEK